MPDRETAHLIRGTIARAVVKTINDTAETQTADVQVYRGVERTGVEVVQPFGLASVAPDGGLGIVLAVGGDQGDLALLPVAKPARRLGNLQPGEAALYGQDGSRVHVKTDGVIEATAARTITVHVGELALEIEQAGNLVRLRFGAGAAAPRVTLRPDYAKIAMGGNALIVTAAGVFSTVPVIVAPDPEPDQ